MSVSDFLGYAAASLVLATFSLRSMAGLRSVAIASNVMFIAYAISAQLIPVLILHALLLPLNAWRLREDIAKHGGTYAVPANGQRTMSSHAILSGRTVKSNASVNTTARKTGAASSDSVGDSSQTLKPWNI